MTLCMPVTSFGDVIHGQYYITFHVTVISNQQQ